MTNFKLPSKKQVYKQFLNHQLLGKKANLYFAEYGREGSGCKIIIESRMVDFDKYAYWQPINIQKFEVIIKDCEKCNVGNWFKYILINLNTPIFLLIMPLLLLEF